MIEIACPHCGSINRKEDRFAGLRVPCEVCRKEFKVPLSFKSFSGGSSEPTSPAPQSQASPPHDSFDLTAPEQAPAESKTPKPATPAMPQTPSALPSSDSSAPRPKPASSSSRWQTEGSPPSTYDELEPLPFDDESFQAKPQSPQGAEPDPLKDWDSSQQASVGANRPSASSDLPVYDSVESPLKLEGMVDAQADDIRAKCGICDSVVWVKRHKAGMTVVCPDCGSEVKVPKDQAVAQAPRGPEAGKVTSKVFTGVSSTEAGSSGGWRDRQPAVHERSERAKKLEQLDGQKTIPHTRQRVWGQPPDPEPKVDEAQQQQEKRGRVEEEPELYDADDWIRDALRVLIDKGFLLGVGAVALMTIPYMLVLWVRVVYVTALSGSGIASTFASAGVMIFWLALLVAKSVVGATIAIDTANRSHRIESWPEFNPAGLLSQGSLFLIPYACAAVPSTFVAGVGIELGLPSFLWIPVASFAHAALLAPLLLSTLRSGSAISVFDPEIFASFRSEQKVWMTGYAILVALASVEAIVMILAMVFGVCFSIASCIVLALTWGLQIRVIGILGRRIARSL